MRTIFSCILCSNSFTKNANSVLSHQMNRLVQLSFSQMTAACVAFVSGISKLQSGVCLIQCLA